jgi:hypothetical protein
MMLAGYDDSPSLVKVGESGEMETLKQPGVTNDGIVPEGRPQC